MNDLHSFDPLEAARRATEAEKRLAVEGSTATVDLEAELREILDADERVRDAIHADAWTIVARLHQRLGLDPTIFRSHSARTAIGIARLLIAEMGERGLEDAAFQTMNESEARSELEKTRRTAPAFKAIAGLAR